MIHIITLANGEEKEWDTDFTDGVRTKNIWGSSNSYGHPTTPLFAVCTDGSMVSFRFILSIKPKE